MRRPIQQPNAHGGSALHFLVQWIAPQLAGEVLYISVVRHLKVAQELLKR